MKTWILTRTLVPLFLLLAGTHSWALQANGAARYNELGNQIYIAVLYLDSPIQSPQEILNSSQRKRMELHFSGDMSKRRWSQHWTQSIAINSSRETMIAAAEDLSSTLSSFKGDLLAGDVVIFDYDPVNGTSVSVNGIDIARGKSRDLFSLFLSAWIGPVPPRTDFKESILGKESWQDTYATFQKLSPSEDRVAIIAGWQTDLKKEQEQALAEAQAEEAAKKAEEEAQLKAEQAAMEEQQRLALIEEEKRKAREEARKAAEEAARLAAQQAEMDEKEASDADENGEDEEDTNSVEAILAQQDYTTNIIGKIYRNVKYPSSAVNRNQEGSVRARVVISRDGSLQNVQVIEEAEFSSLNKAVVDAINDAAPFPEIPATIKSNTLDLTVPVSFRLN